MQTEILSNKNVLDLGCGTGRLALGAAFLGAESVVGVDIDRKAVNTASENTATVGLGEKVQWIAADVDAIHGSFDTVLQNPPFGVQKRGADRKFVTKALELGSVAYSLHKRPGEDLTLLNKVKASGDGAVAVSPSPFMKKFIEENGGRIDGSIRFVDDCSAHVQLPYGEKARFCRGFIRILKRNERLHKEVYDAERFWRKKLV